MYYIGIDVGGMSIKGGIVDENGNIIVKDSVVTKPTQPSDDNTKDIAGLVAKLLEDAGISTDEIAGMGMGVPGTVDPDTAKIFYTCNIFFRDYDFRAEFKKYFDFPVYIGNDADCAVIGESVFGGQAGSHLTRATVVMTAVFFLLTLVLASLIGHGVRMGRSDDGVTAALEAPVAAAVKSEAAPKAAETAEKAVKSEAAPKAAETAK